MRALTLIVSILFTGLLFAQDEVIIIDKGKGKEKSNSYRLNDNTSILKFAPLNMLAGEITFGYEHQTSIKGSIDMELGATLSNIGFGTSNHIISPNQERNSGFGFVTGFGYRYYPLDNTEALNRFYVSPVVRYRLYTFGEKDLSGNLPNTNGRNSSFSFLFNFGYELWASESFAFDFYCGMGLGYQEILSHNATYSYGQNDWYYEWNTNLESGARYVFTAGLKVGIGWKDY